MRAEANPDRPRPLDCFVVRWVGLLVLVLLGFLPVGSFAHAETGPNPPASPPDRAALEADLAGADVDRAARAAFALGELDERAFAYAAALAHYQAVLRLDPAHWFSATARTRAQHLSLYVGEFAALAVLDAVRKDPRRADDAGEIDRLALAMAGLPPGRVRAEGHLFVAQAWVGRLGAPARAIEPALTAARTSPDPGIAAAAWDVAWLALQRTGDLPRARVEIAADPRAPEALRRAVTVAVRRVRLHQVSVGVAAAALLGAAFALGRVIRDGRLRAVFGRLLAPRALAFLVLAPLGGAFVAEKWEHGMAPPFLAFGVGLVVVHACVSLWSAAFARSPRAPRLVGAALYVGLVLAAAYLALERSEAYGASFLGGFGL